METGFVAARHLAGHRASKPSPGRCALEREDCGRNRSAIGGALPLSYCAFESRRRNLLCRSMASLGNPLRALSLLRVSPHQSLVMLGHCFGAYATPGGSRSSASLAAPLRGLGSSPKKFENSGKERRTNFFQAPPRMQPFGTWESRPLARLRPV